MQANEILLDAALRNGINPYALGFAMYRDIRRICEEPTEVLNRVLSLPGSPPEPEPVSPLPTQLRWAL